MEVIFSFFVGFWISVPITALLVSPVFLYRNKYPSKLEFLFGDDWNIFNSLFLIIWFSNSLEGMGIEFNLRILRVIGNFFTYLLELIGFFQ